MKYISSINSWLIGNIGLIAALIIAYIVSQVFLVASWHVLAGLILCVLLLVLIRFPRGFIYFFVGIYPFTGLITKFTGASVLGAGYAGVNIGGMITIFGLMYGMTYLIVKRPRIFEYELTLPAVVYLSIILIDVFISPKFLFSFRQWARYTSQAFIYFIIMDNFRGISDARKLTKFVMGLFAPLAIYFLLAIYFPSLRGDIMRNVRWGWTEMDFVNVSMYRLTGFQHSGAIGSYIVIYFAFVLYFIYESEMRARFKYFALFGIMLIELLYSLARNAWLSFAFVMTVIGVLRFRKFFIIGLIIILFVLAINPSTINVIWMRMQPDASAMGRIDHIKSAWGLFLQRPVLGWGQGYYQLWHGEKTKWLGNKPAYGIGGTDAHTEHFRILAENGLLGLLAYFWLFYRGLKLSYRLHKIPADTAKNYSMVVFATVASIFIYGLTAMGFKVLAYYFWTFMSIGEIFLRSFRDQHGIQPEGVRF
jgi:O-antigen ligase